MRRALASLAATATAGLLALGMAAPAAAEPGEESSGGAKAKYTGNLVNGLPLEFEGRGGSFQAALFKLDIKGKDDYLPAYCIDFETAIVTQAKYQEGQWEDYPGEGEFADSQPGKVLWILQNSYPRVEVSDLGENAGIDDLTKEEAVSATQAAIWHFSNGVALSEDSPDNVGTLYGYLLDQATEITQAPASLSFTPDEASGESGGTVGEFTVATTAESVPLTLDSEHDVTLVDGDGNEIDTVSDGDTFSVQVPEGTEDGQATISGSVEATVQIGRLFKGVDVETQTLITAGEGSTEAAAEAVVNWTKPSGETPPPDVEETTPPPNDEETTPPPDDEETEEATPPPGDKTPPADDRPGLPVTGAQLGGLIAAAVIAIGGGAAAMFLARRRRSGNEAA